MTPDSSTQQAGVAYPADLLPQHLELIKKSAISPEVARARGYRSAKTPKELVQLGFKPRQGNVPALVIPMSDVDRKDAGPFIRADRPRKKGEREIKYELPKGKPLKLDVPASSHAALSDTGVTLWVADGPRQADALASIGEASIATLGYWGWRHFRTPRKPLRDWDKIKLQGRTVIIAWGSRAKATPEGEMDLRRFTIFLSSRGAVVKYAIPSPDPNGKHLGIDDILAAGQDPKSLLTEPPADLQTVPSAKDLEDYHPYLATEEGLFVETQVGEDTYMKALTQNWTARIKADILMDDGLDQRRFFEIEGAVRDRKSCFRVSAQEFDRLDWVLQKLGAEAVIWPGYAAKDHVRAAIQLTSGAIPVRKEFGYTGWVRLNGKWVYLHADGAIGAAKASQVVRNPDDPASHNTKSQQDLSTAGSVGPVSEHRTRTLCANLPGALSRFCLPPPPVDPDIVANLCEMALFIFLKAAIDRVSYALLALVFRSVLGPIDFSVQLVGKTGNLKTSLAVVAQQFFGAGLDVEHLVGHFAGTATSLESLAFLLNNMLLVIDDFSPTGSKSDIQRTHRDADRFFRAKANFGGRSRARPDGSYRGARSPRAAILFTGEEIPEGHSLRARILTIEVNEGDVDSSELKLAQTLASSGRFAELMSAFLQWLAPRLDKVQEGLSCLREQSKTDPIPPTVHRRTYQAVRELEFSFGVFLQFALEFHAIQPKREEEFQDDCWKALEDLAFAQEHFQQSANPIEQFEYLVSALFAAKRIHVCDLDSGNPPLREPEAWGYHRRDISYPRRKPDGEYDNEDPVVRTDWIAGGTRVGWVNRHYLYFIPEILYGEIQGLAQRLGAPIPLSLQTLAKRLADHGIIVRDEERGRLRHRITVAAVRESVFVVPIGAVRSLWRLRWETEYEQDFAKVVGLEA